MPHTHPHKGLANRRLTSYLPRAPSPPSHLLNASWHHHQKGIDSFSTFLVLCVGGQKLCRFTQIVKSICQEFLQLISPSASHWPITPLGLDATLYVSGISKYSLLSHILPEYGEMTQPDISNVARAGAHTKNTPNWYFTPWSIPSYSAQ